MVTIDVTPYCTATNTYQIELLAVEICKNIDHDIQLSLDYEGFDITENGLESAVQRIVDRLEIPYKQISFLTNDMRAKSNIFKCKYIGYNEAIRWMKPRIPNLVFPNEKRYCQLVKRPNNTRMYAFHKHLTFGYNGKGDVTFHFNPIDENDLHREYLEFQLEYPKEYAQFKGILPYNSRRYPKPKKFGVEDQEYDFWDDFYKGVSIEIVLETVTTSNTFYPTEKTFRPIQYGKLFLICAGRHYEKYLEDLGFDIFKDILDKRYDEQENYLRIDSMYKSLFNFLRSPLDCNELKTRLHNNQLLLDKLIREEDIVVKKELGIE